MFVRLVMFLTEGFKGDEGSIIVLLRFNGYPIKEKD